MWKYKPFYDFLLDMALQEAVGQIVIIDNDPENKPDIPALNHPKVEVYTFGRNIFVNPAWNIGVSLAKYDQICLYGDDTIFDLKLFNRMIPHVTPYRGVFGMCPGKVEYDQPPVITGEIGIQHCPFEYHYHKLFGFGMMMFLHKNNWVNVPEGLDLFWGDNFIYDTQYFMMNQNYIITNLFHHTPYSVTASSIENHMDMYHRETALYNQVMPQLISDIRAKNSYRTGFN